MMAKFSERIRLVGEGKADAALMAAQEGRCSVAYRDLRKAVWNNGAAWAHRTGGGSAPTLTAFDRVLQHAEDTFRNLCTTRR